MDKAFLETKIKSWASGIAILLTLLLLQGCGMGEIVRDMDTAFMQSNGKIDDVSPSVQKYFPPGMKLSEAIATLERHGFKVVRERQINSLSGRKIVPEGEVWYSATKRSYERINLFISKRALVLIEADGERVLRSRAYVFVDGL